MNNLYFILSLINICAIQTLASPVPVEETVYELVTKNFSTICPNFTQNVIVNNLSTCKGVALSNLPKKMSLLNLNTFYCVGMMVADLELCNTISLKENKYLPKSAEELKEQLTKIQNQDASSVCLQLKNMKLFNAHNIPKELTETIAELKTKLSKPLCSNLCTDISEENVSDLCVMMNYLNNLMDNVTKSVDIVPKSKQVLVAIPQEHKQQVQPKVTIAQVNLSKDVNKVNTKLPVNNIPPQSQLPVIQQPQQQKIAPVVEKVIPEPPKQKPSTTTQTQTPIPDATTKSEINSNLESKELKVVPLPKVTKQENLQPQPHKQNDEVVEKQLVQSNGEKQNEIQLTNKATNTNGEKGDKLDFASAEEREYPTTSTAINYVKNDFQNSDNFGMDIETDGDDDVDQNMNEVVVGPQENVMGVGDLEISSKIKATEDIEESNFFSYFMFISVMFIAGYVVYHNKQKIMALLLEGRRERNSRRRPSTSSYRKLNSNLEEAVTSKCSGSASHVIY